jgi:hypothetical protein
MSSRGCSHQCSDAVRGYMDSGHTEGYREGTAEERASTRPRPRRRGTTASSCYANAALELQRRCNGWAGLERSHFGGG